MTRRLGSWHRCTRLARRRAAVSGWRPARKQQDAGQPEDKRQEGQG
ncbi:hypothetical protein V8Z80_07295 [Orrella sp. JC864]